MPNLYNVTPIHLGRSLGDGVNILFMTEGARSAILHVTATSSGAGIWEGTMEDVGTLGESGADWYPLPSATINATTTRNAPGATVTPTDDDILVADNLGAKYVRFRRTAGTATANVALSELTLDQVIASSGGSMAVTTTPPAIQCTSFICDGTDEILIDATARKLWGIDIFHIDATPVYGKLYDKATAASESDTPVHRTGVPANPTSTLGAGTNKGIWPAYIPLTNGLAFRGVTGIADNNDSALTTAEVIVNVYWSA